MNFKLARIAEAEARKNYHGNTVAAIGNLYPIASLFANEKDVTEASLDADWSGAFVYLCTSLAGLPIPPRYPDPRIGGSFTTALAWARYARLPKIHLWHDAAEEPMVGDLVVIGQGEDKPLQIGIVLSVGEDALETAEGNYHNHSALVERKRDEHILGYIRLVN